MKILVVGAGYVGLVTATCFAEMGHNVCCLDIDEKKIEKLKMGKTPFFEPGLKELVKRNSKNERLKFTTSYCEGTKSAHACFLCVPTPSKPDGSPDIFSVIDAAKKIAHEIENYCVVVNKSTVPINTYSLVKNQIENVLEERNCSVEFDVVSNPEFLKEGDAVNDFMKPDRIVIGTENERAIDIMREIYASFTHNHERFIIMDPISAETTKYAANAMLALRISFMNEIAKICEKTGGNIDNVRKGIGSDRRIGYSFLYAGAGFGGSCFRKDVKALDFACQQMSLDNPIIKSIEITNESQKRVVWQKIKDYFGELSGRTIAIWGLSFKPGTDDLRESPAIALANQLLREGAFLQLYDPIAMPNAKKLFNDRAVFCKNEIESAQNADAIALMTEWKQFRSIDFVEILNAMKGNVFFDGRNQYCAKDMASHGFDYISIGRATEYAKKGALV